jgi:hypothetical protein
LDLWVCTNSICYYLSGGPNWSRWVRDEWHSVARKTISKTRDASGLHAWRITKVRMWMINRSSESSQAIMPFDGNMSWVIPQRPYFHILSSNDERVCLHVDIEEDCRGCFFLCSSKKPNPPLKSKVDQYDRKKKKKREMNVAQRTQSMFSMTIWL